MNNFSTDADVVKNIFTKLMFLKVSIDHSLIKIQPQNIYWVKSFYISEASVCSDVVYGQVAGGFNTRWDVNSR